VVEVAGYLYVEAPKNRKYRRTVYPRRTPAGYPLAERLVARIEQARAEQATGTNPLGSRSSGSNVPHAKLVSFTRGQKSEQRFGVLVERFDLWQVSDARYLHQLGVLEGSRGSSAQWRCLKHAYTHQV